RSEEGAWTPERLAGLAGVDAVIRLSAALGGQGIYPTVDPLTSRSRLLEAENVDRAHVELAARIREALAALLAPGGDPPAAGESAQSRHRWRGTGSGSISAGPSPTSPSSTRRGASCSV